MNANNPLHMTIERQPWLAYGLLISGLTVISVLMFQAPEPLPQNSFELIDYQNEELGISFKYPASLGKIKENYRDENLAEIAFSVGDDINFRSAPGQELPSCEGVEYDCRILTVNERSITLITFPETASVNRGKVFYIPTQQGIWTFQAANSVYYQDLFNTVSTLKYSLATN